MKLEGVVLVKRNVVVGLVLGVVMVTGSCFAESRQVVNEGAGGQAVVEIGAEYQGFLNGIQGALDQAYLDGDQGKISSLTRMMNQFARIDSTSMYTVASSAAFAADAGNTDEVDLVSSGQNAAYVSSIYDASVAELARQQAARDAVRAQRVSYAQGNGSVLNSAPSLPVLPDGSQATIYAVSRDGIYYYVNAGSYSDVAAGQEYPIGNGDGDYVGNVRIACVSQTFSVGVLSNSYELSAGWTVGGVVTRVTDPNVGSGGGDGGSGGS